MVGYEKHIFDNGLTLILHHDGETPLVTVNTLYGVGSRNESPTRTGFAHLFEHLMFGGTKKYPDFDQAVECIGGESNAFTNNDYTNYYITAPSCYVERVLDIEFDRMCGLDWSEKRLAVQQRVVTEEYNQRYINQPYGDVWLLLRPLCFKQSPYRWCTIGADIRHVSEATLGDVRKFFDRFYQPCNAVMAIAGNIDIEQVYETMGRLYPGIGGRTGKPFVQPDLEKEPPQTEARRLEVKRDVPSDALYRAYVMCGRTEKDFVAFDMISDILSNGKSSRLYEKLVRDKQLFSEINAYVTGDCGEGLFVVSGKTNSGVSHEAAERAVDDELERMATELASDDDLQKVASKFESTFVYSQYKASDRALALCCYEWLKHIDWVNNEPELYRQVTPADIRRVAERCFAKERSNTLWVNV